MKNWKRELRDRFGMPEFKDKEFIKHSTYTQEVEDFIMEILEQVQYEFNSIEGLDCKYVSGKTYFSIHSYVKSKLKWLDKLIKSK